MQRLVLVLFVGVLAVGACNQAPDTVANAPAEETGQTSSVVGTAGNEDLPRAATPLETAVAKTVVREVVIPEGTELSIVLDTSVGSDTSKVEETVRAHLSRAVSVNGEPVLAEGSSVIGVVTDAKESGKVQGRAHVAVRFDTVVPSGGDDRYQIATAAVGRTAPGTKKDDAIKIGAPAAGGAIIGAIVGGGKGAAIGTAIGGGAGTGVVLATSGKEIHLPVGSALRLRLMEPLTIRIRS